MFGLIDYMVRIREFYNPFQAERTSAFAQELRRDRSCNILDQPLESCFIVCFNQHVFMNTKELNIWELVGALTSSRYKMVEKINNDRNLKSRIKRIEDYIVKK
jgi:hypothetical protein